VFSLFAGQPLVIIGTTGPLLMFDESLYSVSESDFVIFPCILFHSIATIFKMIQ